MSTPTLNATERYSIAQLGYAHLEHDRLEEARALFEGLSVLASRDAYVWRALAEIARRQLKHDLAAQYLRHCIEIERDVADHRVALASLHLAQLNRDEAWQAIAPLRERALAAEREPLDHERRALVRARVLLKTHFGVR